jgi:hypothetical protein
MYSTYRVHTHHRSGSRGLGSVHVSCPFAAWPGQAELGTQLVTTAGGDDEPGRADWQQREEEEEAGVAMISYTRNAS